MRGRAVHFITVALLGGALAVAVAGRRAPTAAPGRAAATVLPSLPRFFEPRPASGAMPPGFVSRGKHLALRIEPDQMIVRVRGPVGVARKPSRAQADELPGSGGATVRIRLLGGNPAAAARGERELPGKVNYLLGRDPSRWRRNVPTYAAVRQRGVYPGIDVLHYGTEGALEHDYVVAPGAEPSQIRLSVEGAASVKVDAAGDLRLRTPAGELIQRKPVAYQVLDGKRVEVPCAYRLAQRTEWAGYPRSGWRRMGAPTPPFSHSPILPFVQLAVAAYDRSRTLVIDPVLVFSSYFGGSQGESGRGVATDNAGNVYLTGSTVSDDLPVTPGVVDPHFNFGTDVYVAKIDPVNSTLVYATFIGSDPGNGGNDYGNAIAVGTDGSAYVTGLSDSSGFPAVNAFQPTYGGGPSDAFVFRLDATGSSLLYSSYLGGSGTENTNTVLFNQLGKIAVDPEGAAYVTGSTSSTNFPTVSAFQPLYGGGSSDAFVTKVNPSGATLQYSSYLGGSSTENLGDCGIAVRDGSAYLTGDTKSTNFPTASPLFTNPTGDAEEGFVTQVSPSGSSLVYSTYLFGSGFDSPADIAVGAGGGVVVVGSTNSSDLPATPSAFQKTIGGGNSDIFVAKLAPHGASLVYLTYLGGSTYEYAGGVALDATGAACLAGSTDSPDFPTRSPATPRGGAWDAVVARISADGSALLFSTYLGGAGDENPFFGGDVALDPRGNILLAGNSVSANFPTVRAIQASLGAAGASDAFLAKISEVPLPDVPATFNVAPAGQGMLTLTWSDPGNRESFEIQRKTAAGPFAPVTTTTALRLDDAGLQPATRYTYRIRTLNLAGASPWSPDTSATTLPLPPGAPTGLAAHTTTPNSIRLSWTDGSTNEDGFIIERSVNGGSLMEHTRVGPDVSVFVDPSLAANTSYGYSVRAFNAGGESPAAGPVTVDTITAPSDLAAAFANGKVTLTWQDQSVTDTGVAIERAVDPNHTAFSQLDTVGGTVTTFVDASPPPGKTVAYRIRGVNQNAESEYTAPVTVRIPFVLAGLSLKPASLVGGRSSVGTVTMSGRVTETTRVTLKSSPATLARVPASVVVLRGRSSASFKITTRLVPATRQATITAMFGSSTRTARLTVSRR